MTEAKQVITRIDERFALLKQTNRAGFVTFITAGDPDLHTSLNILKGLPEAGADVIELGMPFSDPMADGPAIQASSLRALKTGASMIRTLELVRAFRTGDNATPIVLMGYYNPIYQYGVDRFLSDAKTAGVDGLIIVDLPPEEDEELCLPAIDAGISFIRLATPTTDNRRLPMVLRNTSGFLYYVSIMGITGTQSPNADQVRKEVERIRTHTDMPIAVGFGIRTPEQARDMAQTSDAVVVGSALVDQITQSLDPAGNSTPDTITRVLDLTRSLASGVQTARLGANAE